MTEDIKPGVGGYSLGHVESVQGVDNTKQGAESSVSYPGLGFTRGLYGDQEMLKMSYSLEVH